MFLTKKHKTCSSQPVSRSLSPAVIPRRGSRTNLLIRSIDPSGALWGLMGVIFDYGARQVNGNSTLNHVPTYRSRLNSDLDPPDVFAQKRPERQARNIETQSSVELESAISITKILKHMISSPKIRVFNGFSKVLISKYFSEALLSKIRLKTNISKQIFLKRQPLSAGGPQRAIAAVRKGYGIEPRAAMGSDPKQKGIGPKTLRGSNTYTRFRF